MSKIRIEFYGIPRHRTGVAETTVCLQKDSVSLSEVLMDLCSQFPDLAVDCIRDGQVAPGMIVNFSGDHFVSDAATFVPPGETILLMSADSGG